MGLKKSKGVKRYITSILALVTFAATFIPELTPVVELLRTIAGGVGAVALTHAAYAGTLGTYVSGSIASGLSALLALFEYLASSVPFVGAIYWIAGLTGTYAVGAKSKGS